MITVQLNWTKFSHGVLYNHDIILLRSFKICAHGEQDWIEVNGIYILGIENKSRKYFTHTVVASIVQLFNLSLSYFIYIKIFVYRVEGASISIIF